MSSTTYQTPADSVHIGTLWIAPEVAAPLFLERAQDGHFSLIQADGTGPPGESDLISFTRPDLPALIALLQQALDTAS